MYPHCIRLRGPWDCQPLERHVDNNGRIEVVQGALPPPRQMALPCRWNEGGLDDFAGRVRFVRSFGYPSRVDAHERLWLTFEGADSLADVWLNGQCLGRHEGAGSFEYEVTEALKARNQLAVEVESPTPNGGLWGEVALEVRCPAYLRNVEITSLVRRDEVDLRATGEVVGVSELPLELQLLLGGKTLVYRPVEPSLEGLSFELLAPGLKLQLATPGSGVTQRLYKVRVDLVCGPMVWYGVQKTMTFRGHDGQ